METQKTLQQKMDAIENSFINQDLSSMPPIWLLQLYKLMLKRIELNNKTLKLKKDLAIKRKDV